MNLFLGRGKTPQNLLLKQANRHGLIAGATGTGKTVTLQIMAEGFSRAGVPVFAVDVKGDLSGLAAAGSSDSRLHDKLLARAQKIGLKDYAYEASPTVFWDVYGEKGHPVHTTLSDMGPLLLARLFDLSETQTGVLHIAFAFADDEGLLLLDLKDLRALLAFLAEHKDDIAKKYGLVHTTSVSAIQRKLLSWEREGAKGFFGEPALNLQDFMRCDLQNKGIINLLDATRLIEAPGAYGAFLLWLLSELFEELPEVGDPDKPKLVFFFDEAHLLFRNASKTLIEKIEQVIRLIRSKGVGIFFVTQNPLDLPETVLAQLGTRIQHALRAYTPKERKAVKAAAQSFRPNPAFDTLEAITDLGVGEALVSTLDDKGRPGMVERTLIRPPASRLGPVTPEERDNLINKSALKGRYETLIDRVSAYEVLAQRAEEAASEESESILEKDRSQKKILKTAKRSPSRRQSPLEAAFKTALRTASSQITRALVRGILGSLTKGR